MNRRLILKSATATLALPWLPSLNHVAFAREKQPQAHSKMVFLCMGWGVTKETWYPDIKQKGENYELSEGLKPLQKHKKDMSIIQNTEHQFTINGHHGSTFYLTGANQYAIAGKSFSNTISVDQVAAAKWGKHTRYNSLPFDCKDANNSGHGPGLSASWDSSGKPIQGLPSPLQIYNKLFGQDELSIDEMKAMIADQRSTLDIFLLDLKRINKKLNSVDREKLEEYQDSVREIENQLEKQLEWMGRPKPAATLSIPEKEVNGYEETKLMYDLIVSALQTDSTRVVTYRQPVDTLVKAFDIVVTSHNMTHYDRGARYEVSQFRDTKQSELLSYFLDKLKATRDSHGISLFDSTTVSYGSNISHGHTLRNCPAIVAGNPGRLKLGQQVVLPEKTPLCNLWLTLLQANGIQQEKFGDSQGLVEELLV